MQTINLNLYKKTIIPLLFAKQGDVGRKFKAVFADGQIPDGAAFSVWYSGASGEGNYTAIGDTSAFSVSGDAVTVELITQMLTNAGAGLLCLVMNGADGSQLGSWNIPYMVEHVPGMGSAAAEEFYTAFSEAVANLPYPDASLTAAGKAADAKATGDRMYGYAKAHNLLDNSDFTNPVNQRGAANLSIDTTKTYFIDRWCGARSVLSLVDGGVSVAWDSTNGTAGYIQQIVPGDWAQGDIVTFTAKIDGEVLCGVVTLGASGAAVTSALKNSVVLSISWLTGRMYCSIITSITSGITIEWAALYKGEYTVDTLPPYVPKGYGAELAECLRHTISLGGTFRYRPCQTTTTLFDFAIPVPQPMRAYPSFDTSKLTLYGVSDTTQTEQTGFTFAVADNGMNGFVIRATKSGHGLTDAMLSIASGTIFSADM